MESIKLNSLSRWNRLAADGAVMFDGPERRIRLFVNVETETAFFYQTAETEADCLLAVVSPGVCAIEFYAGGKLAVLAVPASADAQVWYQTAESEPTHIKVVDPVVFTKIAQRRERNPELERMFGLMVRNQRQREAQMNAEFERRLGAIERAKAAPAPAPAPKKKGKSDGSNPPKADGNSRGDGKPSGEAGDGGETPKADE